MKNNTNSATEAKSPERGGPSGGIPTLQSPYSKINNLLYLSYLPKVINAAIEVNLFEVLFENNFTVDDIAERLETQKNITEALLKVLAKIGLVSFENGFYGLTALAEDYLIKSSGANQLKSIHEFSGSNGMFDFLVQALKGEISEFDGKMWSSKEASISMEQGMKAGGLQSVVAFVKSIPEFEFCTRMCDFAGNTGYFSYALLQENPNLNAHVYDFPVVCENAKELKQNEPDFDRVTYHEFDVKKDKSFGEDYDFFFISHFLYEYAAKGELADFLRKVNIAMKPNGILVSNHICDRAVDRENELTLAMVELHTRIVGYPTHQLSESALREALNEAGFCDFTVQQPDGTYAFPTLLLAARKK